MTDSRNEKAGTARDDNSRDANYSPASDSDTAALQYDQDSPAFADGDIDRDAVKTLPGTGGPDDEGDIELPPKP